MSLQMENNFLKLGNLFLNGQEMQENIKLFDMFQTQYLNDLKETYSSLEINNDNEFSREFNALHP